MLVMLKRVRWVVIGVVWAVLAGCGETPTVAPVGGVLPQATAGATVVRSGTSTAAATATTVAIATSKPTGVGTAISAGTTAAPTVATVAPTAAATAIIPAFVNAPPLPDVAMSGAIAGRVPVEQRSAMLDATKGDSDVLAAAAPVYAIAVRVAGDNATYEGHERLNYVNATGGALNDLVFRLYANVYSKTGGSVGVSAVAVDGQVVGGPFQPSDSRDSYLDIPLPTPLAPNAATTVELAFNGAIPKGFDLDNYGQMTYEDGALNMAQFYPQIDVWEKGGWAKEDISYTTDLTYAEAAFYTVDVYAPTALKVFGTGVSRSVGAAGGVTQTRFVTGAVREFAFFAGPNYVVESGKAGDVVVNVVYNTTIGDATALKTEADLNLRLATAAISTYSTEFGQYPYAKMDVLFCPTKAGGIEWPTIVQADQNTLAKPGHTYLPTTLPNVLPDYGDNASFIVAHELAHQWWYSVVGDDQQKTTWIDEGLANYSSYFLPGLANVGKDSAAVQSWESWMTRYIQDVVLNDVGRVGDIVVNQPATGFATVDGSDAKVDLAAYQKTPLFYDTYRRVYGDAAFLTYTHNLFAHFKYKIARSDDVLKELEAAAPGHDAAVAALFQRWLQEMHVKEDVK